MNVSVMPSLSEETTLLEDRLLRAVDVQAQLGMSRAKVYRLMQLNILPTVRIGGSVRVPQKALCKWIEENTRHRPDSDLLT